MGNKGTNFENAIEYIQEKYKISKKTISEEINNCKNVFIQIDKSKISQYIANDRPSDEVIQAMHELYHINPDYLKRCSDVMIDGAGIILETINKIFTNWSTTVETTYSDSDGKEITNTFLHVTMKECYYNFLKKVDSVKFLKEQGMKSFDAELAQCKKEFNDTKDEKEWEYVILPKNSLIDIVTFNKQSRKALEELLDLEKYFPNNSIDI